MEITVAAIPTRRATSVPLRLSLGGTIDRLSRACRRGLLNVSSPQPLAESGLQIPHSVLAATIAYKPLLEEVQLHNALVFPTRAAESGADPEGRRIQLLLDDAE